MTMHATLLSDPFSGLPAAGIDEAGRGCLAGPVVAGAAVLPEGFALPGLTDSKALSPEAREKLYPQVRQGALAWGLGVSWPWEIDRVNILQATFLAMARAVAALNGACGRLLVDGDKTVPEHALQACGLASLPQRSIVGGDALEPCISAASILAKVWRDRLMTQLERRYPGYGFAGHKGYGTKAHMAAIQTLGACRMHRMTFRGVRAEDKPQGAQACLPGI